MIVLHKRFVRVLGILGLFMLAGGAGLPQATADAPVPVVPLMDGAVTPHSFDGDMRILPYVAPTSGIDIEVNPQPSLFKWAQALKTGGVAPQQGPDIPAAAMPAPSLSFNAMTFNSNGAGHPPDTNGDVGPQYYMEAVNTSVGIYRKSDGSQVSVVTFNSFWSGAGTGTACDNSNRGDPITLYDAIGHRWLFMDFAWGSGLALQNGPYYFCFAVSKTVDPTGAYWLYAIRADDNAHAWLPDYPKGAVWPDGFYFTANMFDCLDSTCGSATNEGVRSFVFNRTKMEAGTALTANDVQIADLSAAYFSLMPSNVRFNLPPAGRPNLLVTEDQVNYHWQVFKFHVDYTNPVSSTFTGPTNVAQATYTGAASKVVEPSPGNLTDTLADRIMFLNQYSRIGNAESLWVQHTTGKAGSSTATPTGIQWAQINVTGGTINTTPLQEQIFNNGVDGVNRFMGSMAVDKDGNAALGYTASSATVAPDIRYVGRLKTDPASTLPRTETTMLPAVTTSEQTGNCGAAACTRWGDYSAMTVDADDGCTFWYANMYIPVAGLNWVTRIGRFRFASPSCVSFSQLYLPLIKK
jgi:hypothetical protein